MDPTFALKALSEGADGVLITGCHPGECHYLEQNYKALRRFLLLRRTLSQMGIEPERVKLVWASAAEGVQLAQAITDMVEEVRALGPLNWPEKLQQAEQNGRRVMESLAPKEVVSEEVLA
jgi:F420-non-reducing hydrogenase iron-sulfur subunit